MNGEKELKFILVGTGNIAKKYVAAIRNIENAFISGVVDITETGAEHFAKEFGIPAWADSMEKMAGAITFDAFILATPSGLHGEGAIKAAALKKHVLSEKPLDIKLDKIDEMISACSAAGVKLGCVFQHRAAEHNRQVFELINSGALGKIYIANASLKNYRGQDYYDSGAWRGTWAMDGGGPFMQQAAHTLDLMVWLMGRPTEIFAFTNTVAHKIEVEDMGHAIVKYSNGAQGVLEASTVVKPGYPNRIEIHGEKGSVILSEEGIIEWDVEGVPRPEISVTSGSSGSKDPMAIGTLGHEIIIKDFIDSIINGKEPMISGTSARMSVELITALYKSAESAEVVKL